MDKLPQPYHEEPGIVIYHGDCREILPLLPDKGVDLVLTDPPYGIGLAYGCFSDTPSNVRSLAASVIPECIRVGKRVVLTCATRQIHFYPEPTWILNWLNRAGSYPNPWGFTCWQPILVYGKDPYLENRMGSRPVAASETEPAATQGALL